MDKEYLIITNNSQVQTTRDSVKVHEVDGLFEDVLVEARRLIHLGYQLETSPLPASHRMLLSPVRSIVLSVDSRPDEVSTKLIEDCIQKYRITMGQRKPDMNNLDDYEYIDKDQVKTGLDELGQENVLKL